MCTIQEDRTVIQCNHVCSVGQLAWHPHVGCPECHPDSEVHYRDLAEWFVEHGRHRANWSSLVQNLLHDFKVSRREGKQ